MSGGRKNDPHVPLGPARRLVPRLFERHAFFDIGGYIRPSEKPKSSGEQQKCEKRSVVCFRSHAFAHEDVFFIFFVCVSVPSESVRETKSSFLRASFGGLRHHSPTLFASHRDVTQRSSKMVRSDPTTVRGVRFPPLAEPSRRRSPPRRLRVARSRVAPLDFSRRRRQRLTGAPRLPRDRRKPSSPRPSSPSRRLTPMSTPSCRRRGSGRCASRLPRARTRRAAARSTPCRRFTRPIALISRLAFH